jgi:hypothetical protein
MNNNDMKGMNNMKKWMRIGNHTWAMVGPCSGNGITREAEKK